MIYTNLNNAQSADNLEQCLQPRASPWYDCEAAVAPLNKRLNPFAGGELQWAIR